LLTAASTYDWYDPIALRGNPGDGDLCHRRIVPFSDFAYRVDQQKVVVNTAVLEARKIGSKVLWTGLPLSPMTRD
jgi:hypothetical protein